MVVSSCMISYSVSKRRVFNVTIVYVFTYSCREFYLAPNNVHCFIVGRYWPSLPSLSWFNGLSLGYCALNLLLLVKTDLLRASNIIKVPIRPQ